MGNPSNASAADPDNYLMKKPEYALSYNRDNGRPNWVSWHLTTDWAGVASRTDTFRPDPEVRPSGTASASSTFPAPASTAAT